MVNISAFDQVASLLQTIAHPVRLQILLALGEEEACVCHLEAVLGRRQAYLSQHLMALREAGLVADRRESRFIFYHLADTRILDGLRRVADLQGIDLPVSTPPAFCDCPICTRQRSPVDVRPESALPGGEPA